MAHLGSRAVQCLGLFVFVECIDTENNGLCALSESIEENNNAARFGPWWPYSPGRTLLPCRYRTELNCS